MSAVPGINASHQTISDECRQKGEDVAVDEALEKLKVAYLRLALDWPLGSDVKFHLVLSVEYE